MHALQAVNGYPMEPSPSAVAAVEYALRRLCNWLVHGEPANTHYTLAPCLVRLYQQASLTAVVGCLRYVRQAAPVDSMAVLLASAWSPGPRIMHIMMWHPI